MIKKWLIISVAAVGMIILAAGVAGWWWLKAPPRDNIDPAIFQRRVGVPVPSGAIGFTARDIAMFDGGEYYMTCRVSAQEFAAFVQAAGLGQDPAKIAYYPGAFRAGAGTIPWWATKEPPDAAKFIGERPDGYIAAWQDNDRMFLRRSRY